MPMPKKPATTNNGRLKDTGACTYSGYERANIPLMVKENTLAAGIAKPLDRMNNTDYNYIMEMFLWKILYTR
jgi:hypothetical protein